MLNHLFQFIGQSFTVLVFAVIIILLIVLILTHISLNKERLIFPKFMLAVTDLFYSPLKHLSKLLGFDETMIDQMSIAVRNHINKNKFKNTDNSKKIIVLPHCLRSADCEAILDETGLVCNECGKCSIGVIKSKAEDMGYKVFVVPGSSFVKKIIKNNDFDSVLGVACYEDLNLTMIHLSDYAPQGVLLSKTGCYQTKVDVRSVLDKIGYYDTKNKKEKSKPTADLEINQELCVKKDKHNY
ncbi:hypothetical protein BGI41_01510 [Methanobrevibacter sp. 87.7]|uniref:DUF116 domain-containing protein n=1 Tax=Methanobrevibacter sp. 87.7 TaxID=387957 RepID=UPI000B502146|nr:DUF116 domain-containing protein [Methanobrevibacter sp. 87.7]OWT33612.1 hypothetical protein BGI41_01510 [Methanobrevibacter sp. 87.7]